MPLTTFVTMLALDREAEKIWLIVGENSKTARDLFLVLKLGEKRGNNFRGGRSFNVGWFFRAWIDRPANRFVAKVC